MLEGFDRQIEAGGKAQAVAVAVHLADHAVIVGRLDHDGNVLVVLGGGADHGRAADVDVLDGVFQGATGLGDGGGEGIEVDHHHVDGGDVVLSHDGVIPVATAEDATVNLGVQSLDAAVHHLGETGVVGDFGDRQTGLGQQLGGATGGEQIDTTLAQGAGELKDSGLVRDTQQGTADGPGLFHYSIVLKVMGTRHAHAQQESP